MLRFLFVSTLIQWGSVSARLTKLGQEISSPSAPPYKSLLVSQKVDHFDATDLRYFTQRILYNDDNWVLPGDPVIFYTGNEGNIEAFWNATGFATTTLAAELNAAVVFAEHRYFGESSVDISDTSGLGLLFDYSFLSVEQALEDFKQNLLLVKEKFPESPIIAIGGSFGGMLAAWLRRDAPHLVAGAICGSGPILQYWTSPGAYFASVTSTCHTSAGPTCRAKGYFGGCDDFVRDALFGLEHVALYYENASSLCPNVQYNDPRLHEVLEIVHSHLSLCTNPESGSDVRNVKEFISEFISEVAMANYPYPTTFLGNFPSFPIEAFCEAGCSAANSALEKINEVKKPNNEVFDAFILGDVPKYPDPTVTKICDLTNERMVFLTAIWDGLLSGLKTLNLPPPGQDCLSVESSALSNSDNEAWGYYTCTSQLLPVESTGVTDFVPANRYDLTTIVDNCEKTYGVKPDVAWPSRFSGQDWSACSNIIFTNGKLDPWFAGGFHSNPSEKCPVFVIPSGAHHLDLRADDPLDPEDVRSVRQEVVEVIRMWLQEWKELRPSDNVDEIPVFF